MNNSQEVRDIGRFIRARREASDASSYSELPARRRHVQHLTQNDLADLVDMSTVVISQIELGRYPNLSLANLEKIAAALRLTTQQEIYVFGLFQERTAQQLRELPEPAWLRPSIDQIAHPVIVANPMLDVVVMNSKARNLLADINPESKDFKSSFLTVFQQPTAREYFSNWDHYTASMVSAIKMNHATMPAWRQYIEERAEIIAETDMRFRELWMQDNPLIAPTLEKTFNHPEVGPLNMKQVLSGIIEAPGLTKVEFVPSDDTTRSRMAQL